MCALFAASLAQAAPFLAQQFPTLNLGRASQSLDLYAYLQDSDVTGTAVRTTVFIGNLSGNIDLALYDQKAPKTVANFLAYVNGGLYNLNIVHRSVPGFLIQGGGYYFHFDSGSNSYFADAVPTFGPIPNEFAASGLSNVAGTIAMAEVGTDPNSATSQWFINMTDNSHNSFNLDSQNGGFTVFGKVLGNGMAVANYINSAQLGPYDQSSFSPAWNQIPLAANDTSMLNNFVVTQMAVVPSMVYSVTSSNTALVTASISGNILTLTPSPTATGITNITISMTALEGAGATITVGVAVVANYTYDLWKGAWSFANSTVSAEAADPDGDGVPNLSEYAFGGDPLHAKAVPGTPQAESGGGITFYHRQAAGLSYAVYESTDLTNWTLVWQTSNGFANPAVFNYTANVVTGFDAVTIRDVSGVPKPLHFWRVQVSRAL